MAADVTHPAKRLLEGVMTATLEFESIDAADKTCLFGVALRALGRRPGDGDAVHSTSVCTVVCRHLTSSSWRVSQILLWPG